MPTVGIAALATWHRGASSLYKTLPWASATTLAGGVSLLPSQFAAFHNFLIFAGFYLLSFTFIQNDYETQNKHKTKKIHNKMLNKYREIDTRIMIIIPISTDSPPTVRHPIPTSV